MIIALCSHPVVFRVDASDQMGGGHVMRCLALAERLTEAGMRVTFICAELQGNLISVVKKKKYPVFIIPRTCIKADAYCLADTKGPYAASIQKTDASHTIKLIQEKITGRPTCVIVDHYGLDKRWEEAIREKTDSIMVIDDLANRSHACDVLLDQNLSLMKNQYSNLVPRKTKVLIGPHFALLRKEFSFWKKKAEIRTGECRRILVFFGSSDPENETEKALIGLAKAPVPYKRIDVVVGSTNPHRFRIRRFCASHRKTHYHCQISNMARMMVRADVAFGGGGSVNWERCCVGLPSLVTIQSKNQEKLTIATAKKRALLNLGWHHTLTSENYKHALESTNGKKLSAMSKRAYRLVDGNGCMRVAAEVLKIGK